MRLAFVTPYDLAYTSVYLHTNARIEEWRRQGLQVEMFVVGKGGRLGRSAVSNLVNDLRTTAELTSNIEAYQPDLICLRWHSPIPGLVAKLRRIAPVIFEVHANDLQEVAGGRPLRTLYIRTLREHELRGGSGACFVTKELSELQEYTSIPGPRGSFGNGTALSQRTKPAPSQRPIVGMALGAPNAWSGLDRFSRLAEELPDMDLVIACPHSAAAKISAAVAKAVIVRGTRSMDEYYNELRSWTVAMGTMALDLKGLSSATPLKVRDYVGLGLPTVLPYWDDDLGTVSDPHLANLARENQASVRVQPEFLKDFAYAAMGQNLRLSTSAVVNIKNIESRRIRLLRQIMLEATQ